MKTNNLFVQSISEVAKKKYDELEEQKKINQQAKKIIRAGICPTCGNYLTKSDKYAFFAESTERTFACTRHGIVLIETYCSADR